MECFRRWLCACRSHPSRYNDLMTMACNKCATNCVRWSYIPNLVYFDRTTRNFIMTLNESKRIMPNGEDTVAHWQKIAVEHLSPCCMHVILSKAHSPKPLMGRIHCNVYVTKTKWLSNTQPFYVELIFDSNIADATTLIRMCVRFVWTRRHSC